MYEPVANQELAPPELIEGVGEEERYFRAILDGPGFKKAPTVRNLLLYLWLHRSESISEYAIATEALGRRPDFDTKADATVRVHVARLRQKLKEFYETDGKDCPLAVSIPRGGHGLEVRFNRDVAIKDAPVQESHVVVPGPVNGKTRLLGIGFVVFVLLCAAQFVQNQRLEATLNQKNVPVERFWKSFVSNGKPTKLFLTTPVFFEWSVTNLKLRDPSVNDFADLENSPELKSYTSKWGRPQLMQNYTVAADAFATLKLSQYLQSRGILLSFGGTGEMTAESFAEDNIILLGTPLVAGKYTRQLEENSNFQYTEENTLTGLKRPILNKHPRPGEPARYETKTQSSVRRTSFGLIAVLPTREGGSSRVLSLTGRPTLPLVSFLCLPASLQLLDRAWAKEGSPEYFEVVVGAEIDGNNVLRTWPEAVRSISVKH